MKFPVSNKNDGGYMAIAMVLILTAIILGIMITVTQLGIGEGQASLALSKGEDTLGFTEGCMEDALLKIWSDPSYTSGTITRPEGTCTVTVSQVGNVYTVTTTGTATNYKRTVEAVVTRGSSMTITSWKEQ